ncbi:hypothetical protein EXU85_31735 [Spirosoma sp. KCTC 42546]|uniref:DUF5689 domain-containing protein n=1 Tax=Spirosoma sp. KCTC 42546 TaxID=2520506 RepID=UPI00115B29B6|nr:DUF5689 domain-containing protein [Spirosoma sp. KCTC 42546]QDK82933.1 hypothetical protein EXU85_31735 [Spirosoma sp. KCTC 42546]
MFKQLLFVLAFLLVTNTLLAQVSLTGTSYTETFDGLGSSLPSSWSIYTGATSTTLGNTATYVSATTAWTSTTGNFRNVASGDLGAGSTNTQQNASTDRAIAIRQTGSLGDPGAAFGVKLANTTGLQDFKLSLKLQSLDPSSARTTIWAVQYGLGDSPTSFTTVATQAIGGSTFSNNTVNYEFGFALDNIGQAVWIRVVALTASTGSGSRPTTGLDDFSLSYSPLNNDPRIAVSAVSLPGMTYTAGETPTSSTTFTVAGKNLSPATPVVVSPSANFEVSTSSSSGFTASPLSLTPAGDGSVNQPIYTRLAAGLAAGPYSGTITVNTTEVASSKSVAVSGTVYPAGATGPCGISNPISTIRAATDGVVFKATGRVTSILTTNIYIQDATGGILLYTGTGTTIEIPELSVGDEIQVAGELATYQTDKELKNFTGCFVKTSAANEIPTSTTVSTATLCNHKGELVTLPSVSIVTPAGTTLSGNTTYTLSDGTQLRIQNGTDLVGATRPSGAVDITGVVSQFNNVCQILPRSTADVPGATANTASCPEVGTGGTAVSLDNTLDIVWWNVEWLGNTGFGPTNEVQQQANVQQQLQAMNQDIYCLEEITDLSKLDAIVATLNTNTGKSYTYTCGANPSRTPAIYYSHWFDIPEVPSDPTTYAQKVCFVYNTAIVTNVSASQILDFPASLSASAWASNRFPLLMSCDVTINGIKKPLKLVGLHAKSGSDASSYSRRIADFNSLKSYLDTTYPTDNVLIMGDYNDDVDQSIYIDATTSTTNITSFSALSTSPDYTVITRQLSNCNISSTASYPDIIDHLTISNEISTNGAFPASGIQYVQNSVKAIRPITGGTTTSDHFPVTARFLFAATDLTPTIDLPQASFSENATNNFVATIAEVGGVFSSTGNTTITISVPAGYTIGYDNTLTSINVTDGTANPVAVDNTKWSVTNNASDIQLTLAIAAGQSIAANGKSVLGFSVTRTSANTGSASNIVLNISDDASQTYDGNLLNNVYSRIISGL